MSCDLTAHVHLGRSFRTREITYDHAMVKQEPLMRLHIPLLLFITLSSTCVHAQDKTVRCSGQNAKGMTVGIDVTFDEIDRIKSIVTFVNEATQVIERDTLSAPSSFIKLGAQQRILMFGFKTFNDGLEEDISVSFVQGHQKLSALKLNAHDKNQTAVKAITCVLLK